LPPFVLPAREQVTGQVDPAVLAPVRAWVLWPPPVFSVGFDLFLPAGLGSNRSHSVTPLHFVFAQLGQIFLLHDRLIAKL
jgi:hypothetical protein